MKKNVEDFFSRLLFFGLIFFFLVGFLALLYVKFGKTSWDPLAFLGAIIGGLITYVGVIQTLKKQENESVLNTYPEKILLFDELRDELNINLKILDHCIKEPNLQGTNAINMFIKDSREYLKKAAKIDAVTYREIYSFFRNFKFVYNYHCDYLHGEGEFKHSELDFLIMERMKDMNDTILKLNEMKLKYEKKLGILEHEQ